ncbi:glycosyltransferase family 4 protein [Aureimonas sp. Leaf324]|uniref:glycosyltransferase family 4 protein n=1 Tax=Aureimonas sp. Leaf324 TaxID=1736336 RepID=UPI000700FFA3|nr:glycosyltransferase family 4 protein [Aureimonas sp. Leaf324]KQQ80817.1 glycosyl transferase group 1 family protein [Aureimonas sp. Leaf324]
MIPANLNVSHAGPAAARPRVAVVSHSHPSLSKGGAEISAYALFRGLRQIGVDAIYIGACASSTRHRLAFADENEFAVFHDAERYDHFYHLAPRSVTDQLVEILGREGVGLVNFHHFYHLGLGALRAVKSMPGMRTYLTIHEFLAICQNHGQMITRQARILCESASNEACATCFPEHLRSQFAMRRDTMLDSFGDFDGFVSPSRFLADRFTDWGLDSGRMSVIENGLLAPAEPMRNPKRDKSWTFGFFGQINPFKGVDVLLDAADLIAADKALAGTMRLRIHGNLIGQGPEFTERFEKSLKAHPFLTYAGAYDNRSVHRLMSECDYVVIPSKWWENSPVVIQEAFGAGAPVICTGIGGMAEKVPDGVAGLHFRLGDAADLLRALRLAADPNNAAVLRAGLPPVISAAEMARRYCEAFGWREERVLPPLEAAE